MTSKAKQTEIDLTNSINYPNAKYYPSIIVARDQIFKKCKELGFKPTEAIHVGDKNVLRHPYNYKDALCLEVSAEHTADIILKIKKGNPLRISVKMGLTNRGANIGMVKHIKADIKNFNLVIKNYLGVNSKEACTILMKYGITKCKDHMPYMDNIIIKNSKLIKNIENYYRQIYLPKDPYLSVYINYEDISLNSCELITSETKIKIIQIYDAIVTNTISRSFIIQIGNYKYNSSLILRGVSDHGIKNEIKRLDSNIQRICV